MNARTIMKGFAFWLTMVGTLVAGHTASAGEASLRPFAIGTYKTILSAHKGKPLLVVFWSITCPPCIAEMPLWRDLLDSHPKVGMALVSTDSFEDERRIRGTLKRYGLAELGSWVFDESFTEMLRADVDRRWAGELPRTYLIGRHGRTVSHSGMVEPPMLQTWLNEQDQP
jgi:thiol-disulfide isomerase/thioredoxin